MNLRIESYVHFPLQGGNLREKSSKYNNNHWKNNTLSSSQYIAIQIEP